MTRTKLASILAPLLIAVAAHGAGYRDGALIVDPPNLSSYATKGELLATSNDVVEQVAAAVAASNYLTNNATVMGLYYTFQTNGEFTVGNVIHLTPGDGMLNPTNGIVTNAIGYFYYTGGGGMWTNYVGATSGFTLNTNTFTITGTAGYPSGNYQGTNLPPADWPGHGGWLGTARVEWVSVTNAILMTMTGRVGMAGNLGTNRIFFSITPYSTTNWVSF